MDEELTLHELGRLEAERKLRTIPDQALETAWVRAAQIEAVVDAVLAVTVGADAKAYAHARRVGEWCARIAAGVRCGPDPSFARRVGALHKIDPRALERIPELRHLARYVRDYQHSASEGTENPQVLSAIVAVAEEFDSRVAPDEGGNCTSPQLVLRSMLSSADKNSRTVVQALMKTLRISENSRTTAVASRH